MMEALSASVSPVSVSCSFATAPISPACNSVTGWMVLPSKRADVREALVAPPMRALTQMRVVFQDAGDHLEISHAAGEGIGDGFKNE